MYPYTWSQTQIGPGYENQIEIFTYKAIGGTVQSCWVGLSKESQVKEFDMFFRTRRQAEPIFPFKAAASVSR